MLSHRFIKTFEVTVSKIFPAGVGWQLASSVVDFAPSSVEFALATGTGDAIGVGIGHLAYNAIMKQDTVSRTESLQTGGLLVSAAFLSGSSWQPIVNILQTTELPLPIVAPLTSLGCGLAFLTGLRLVRGTVKTEYITEVPLRHDIQLSASIGGATGCFVGTDLYYQNFLSPIIGINENDPLGLACARAGLSTSLGFSTAQTIQNLRTPNGESWTD